MSQFVKLNIESAVATVTLHRGELHNAFNDVVIAELTRVFEVVGRDPEARAVVLAGEGKSFCAGADVHWMKRMVDYSVDENVEDALAMAKMLRTIRECPKPVIARVHGAAIGGGVGLTAACDIAAAVESAVFCLSEVKLGIIPAVISPFVMEKIGSGQMRRFGLTAERFSAAEAKRIGLVHEVFKAVEAMDAWIAGICETIRANSPAALAECKKVLTSVAGQAWDELQRLTAERIARIRVSPEGQEGLKSFLEKRQPGWAK